MRVFSVFSEGVERFWLGPRPLRVVTFAILGAVLVVLAGKLITLISGFWCACWVGNLRVGVYSGALGGALFGYIFEPRPYGPRP